MLGQKLGKKIKNLKRAPGEYSTLNTYLDVTSNCDKCNIFQIYLIPGAKGTG